MRIIETTTRLRTSFKLNSLIIVLIVNFSKVLQINNVKEWYLLQIGIEEQENITKYPKDQSNFFLSNQWWLRLKFFEFQVLKYTLIRQIINVSYHIRNVVRKHSVSRMLKSFQLQIHPENHQNPILGAHWNPKTKIFLITY